MSPRPVALGEHRKARTFRGLGVSRRKPEEESVSINIYKPWRDPDDVFDGFWGVYRDGKCAVVCADRGSAERVAAFHSETSNVPHSWEVKRIEEAGK